MPLKFFDGDAPLSENLKKSKKILQLDKQNSNQKIENSVRNIIYFRQQCCQ